MIRLLIPVVLLLMGLGGGITAGLVLTPPAEDAIAGTDGSAESSDDPGAEMAAGEDADASQDDLVAASSGFEYVRLNNQFIVPIVRDTAVRSLVVMSLTVEVSLGQNEAVFDHEPRLRDAFLRVMFAHANAGGFDGSFTEAVAMAPLREGLREAAVGVLGTVVRDVLIVDITRQDA
jgi:hypothetical protein